MVLAILSLLVLVATALSLTSRLEVVSAANYADGIQARMAAKVGIAIAVARSGIAPVQLASSGGGAKAVARASTPSAAATSVESNPVALATDGVVDLRTLAFMQNVSLADVWSQDASARINVNTADEKTLSRLFQTVGQRARVSGGNPQALARAIVEYRTGSGDRPVDVRQVIRQAAQAARNEKPIATTDAPGSWELAPLRGVTGPDLRRADLRVAPLDKERRFGSVTHLLELPGASPLLVEAAAPYLTVFSSSKRYADTTGGARPLADLNTADVQGIYQALTSLYPEGSKSERLLKQFAVNVVDWRDSDAVPTQYPGEDRSIPILGLERTPFITEVWPNSIYPEETDGAGQYIELYNPWSEAIDVTGWSLAIGGVTVAIRGPIAPGGYLIVTDVFDGLGETKKTDGPFDSFYSVFHTVGNATTHRVIENVGLHLPWMEGIHTLRMLDSQGQLADFFTYMVRSALRGQKTSYQRADPRIRVASAAACSPFLPMPRTRAFLENPDAVDEDRSPSDRPFLSGTEVLHVFAGYGDAITGQWKAAYPVLATPASPDTDLSALAADPEWLDARLIDVFTAEEPTLWKLATGESAATVGSSGVELGDVAGLLQGRSTDSGHSSSGRVSKAGSSTAVAAALDSLYKSLDSLQLQSRLARAVAESDRPTVAALGQRGFLRLAEGTRLGAVNLNTAPRAVLASLPGLDDTVAGQWIAEREKQQGRQRAGEAVILFRRPSDLLGDEAFWRADGRSQARYDRLTALLSVATFCTSSVYLDSHTAVGTKGVTTGRRPTVSRAMALVAFDRGKAEFVCWSQSP